MSQWNNSYSFNDQYQNPSVWNHDVNGQYINQNLNSFPNRHNEPTSQYVSFNEFLSQMQPNDSVQPTAGTYSTAQYENYPSNQYGNFGVTSQDTPQNNTFNYAQTSTACHSNGSDVNQSRIPDRYSAVSETEYNDVIAFKSNLTATATEFVPKSVNNKQTYVPQIDQDHSNNRSYNSRNNQRSTSDTNWRERPSSSNQSNLSSHQNNSKYKKEDSTFTKVETSSEMYPNKLNSEYNEPSTSNQDSQDCTYRDESNHTNNDSRSIEPRSQNSNSRNREYSSKNNDQSYRETNSRNHESNYRNRDTSSRNYDYYFKNQETGSKYDNRNQENGLKSNIKNQSKANTKLKNKESFTGTYYNSSIEKKSQDVRNGKEVTRNRNWAGSQRVQPERNLTEDEQFANNYLQYKEDKLEKFSKVQGTSSPVRSKGKFVATDHGANTDMTQRERLMEQLDKGTLECLVCCERVRQTDSVWSCSNCYHVLHLRCIRKWAISSMLEGKWRCPACQNCSDNVPTDYRCMCGLARSPEWQRGVATAHTCGQACGRPRLCRHPCPLLCHPGPCPPCQATVTKQCGCGAETRSVLCSSKLPQVCSAVCNRELNCGFHRCTKDCHEGPCDDCTDTVTQVCHCPARESRTVACTRASGDTREWACARACSRVLACGAHVCRDVCHAPPCAPCKAAPGAVLTCPCGKMKLDKGLRKSCTDPIPVCGNICAKPLPCGPAGDRHFCKLECHEGECPVCPDSTSLPCRCGHATRDVPCADLPLMINNVFCQKKCNKKMSCGRHRCRELCCALATHRCAIPCGRTLSCQLHRCEQHCHTGHCPPCSRLTFEEQRCECGGAVAWPPIPCGAPPPPCSAPCRRPRACGHEPHHACHAGPCPPCVVLAPRHCHGRHEERKTIPCSQEDFSCGLPCGKPLPCGKHTCIKICHKGPCDTSRCTQPCQEKRWCGHACAAPCHWREEATPCPSAASSSSAAPSSSATPAPPATPCPSSTSCRQPVRVTCPCGRREASRTCHENAIVAHKILSALAATKMQDGGSVDLGELSRPATTLKTLECDDECRVEQRTRQMALALQIRNPDISAKLAPRYSDHIRQWAQKDPNFAKHVHEKLTDLVLLAKKSKQKTRSHSFPSMNWQKRQFIHELCEHFGCESVAYDAEPNRNVVATADKKAWLPAMSVTEVLAREAGKRRVPGPVLRPATAAAAVAAPAASMQTIKSSSGWATLTSTNAWATRSQPKPTTAELKLTTAETKPITAESNPTASEVNPTTSESKIDYFDNPPE